MQHSPKNVHSLVNGRRPGKFAGLLAGLAGVVIFGLTLPMTHFALAGFDVYTVGLGRGIAAACLAAIVLAATGQPVPARIHWRRIIAAGAGIVVGFPLLATAAMQYAPSAHGGVMLAILPLATAMASVVIADERPSLGFWLAGIVGSALVLLFAIIEADGLKLQAADLLLLAAVAATAVGYAQSGMLARELGGWQTISWALVFSLPVLVPTTILLAEPIDLSAPASAWLGFVYVALMSQFVGFFFWNKGMALAGVAKTGQLQLLQPFVTLAAAMLLLGEQVGWRHAIFTLAIICVVIVGRRFRVAKAGQQ
jgi:drug/metabolite transporter (DMT)-like permease